MNNIFIPKELHIGFQNRKNTYTGKLAYVVYKDEKGKIRKEASWNSWRNNDIEPLITENIPTEGFVLNKKVGGYNTGWNHRQTYTRVYDPRGFEFEITIENLLYILENTNSIKGKGLEGKFVYGWEGKDLILIPVDSPDYVEINEFNKLIHSKDKIKAKDLKIGTTYLSNKNEEWIYLGKFDYYSYDYVDNEKEFYNKGKRFYFATKRKNWRDEECVYFETIASISGRLIGVVSDEYPSDYSDMLDGLERNCTYSPIDYSKTEYFRYSNEYVKKMSESTGWRILRRCFIKKDGDMIGVSIEHGYSYKSSRKIFALVSSDYRENFDTIDEMLEKYDLMYRKLYLKNGNFYEQEGGES